MAKRKKKGRKTGSPLQKASAKPVQVVRHRITILNGGLRDGLSKWQENEADREFAESTAQVADSVLETLHSKASSL